MAKAVIRKPKKKVCQFCKEKVSYVDYKDTNLLRKFISDRGKIRARRVTGNCLRLFVRAHVTGRTRATQGLDLLLGTAGGLDGQAAGQEVVAGVPALDLHRVTGGPETGDLLREDQLHLAHDQRAVEV